MLRVGQGGYLISLTYRPVYLTATCGEYVRERWGTGEGTNPLHNSLGSPTPRSGNTTPTSAIHARAHQLTYFLVWRLLGVGFSLQKSNYYY